MPNNQLTLTSIDDVVFQDGTIARALPDKWVLGGQFKSATCTASLYTERTGHRTVVVPRKNQVIADVALALRGAVLVHAWLADPEEGVNHDRENPLDINSHDLCLRILAPCRLARQVAGLKPNAQKLELAAAALSMLERVAAYADPGKKLDLGLPALGVTEFFHTGKATFFEAENIAQRMETQVLEDLDRCYTKIGGLYVPNAALELELPWNR